MQYFIFCPYFKTGGPEALHQLCGALRDLGQEAYIWYTDSRLNNQIDVDIIPDYRHYNVALTSLDTLASIDRDDAIWVLPEGLPHDFYGTATKAKQVVWYLATASGNPNAIPYDDPRLENSILLAQSDFGMNEACASFMPSQQVLKVTDYTRLSLLCSEQTLLQENRIAQVVYNPSKGLHVTNALRRFLPDIRFAPVKGMNEIMLRDLGLKSKLYIDFGHHPGKDRLPREMASLGCVVLTGTDGVASSSIDLPIEPLKFQPTEQGYDIAAIACHIRDALSRYDELFIDQQSYRDTIRSEYQTFLGQVQNLIELLS